MSFWVPARSLDPERMDLQGNTKADLEGTLRDIRRVNRYLGGERTLLGALAPYLADGRCGLPLRVLDVGTGSADLPLAVARDARRRSTPVELVAVDRDPVTVAIARRETETFPEISIVQADALRLPFESGAFDVVTASMFLHHFEGDQLVRLLAAFGRLARRAVLINDLRRHRVAWSFIAIASRATRSHPMFVHDAPLSVLRGFTCAELADAARAAGFRGPRLRRAWPYRILMTLPGSGAGA